jgi:hypothetical protein
MITQVREGCGLGQVMVNGACQSRAGMRQERRALRRCLRWNGGVCAAYAVSGWGIGAGVIACTDVATNKAKEAPAINLIICSPLTNQSDLSHGWSCISYFQCWSLGGLIYIKVRTTAEADLFQKNL